MDPIESKLDTRSAEYETACQAMLDRLDTLEERLAQARAGGGERGEKKFRQRGKLLPRERLELLLDPGTPFLELSPLAAYGLYNDESPCASQITGIGIVAGVECMILVNDATVKGGAVYPMTLQKTLRAQTSLPRTVYPASPWWNRRGQICFTRRRYSTMAAESSPTRRDYPP